MITVAARKRGHLEYIGARDVVDLRVGHWCPTLAGAYPFRGRLDAAPRNLDHYAVCGGVLVDRFGRCLVGGPDAADGQTRAPAFRIV